MSSKLVFKFVQDGEFDDPYYNVVDGDVVICVLAMEDGWWYMAGLPANRGLSATGTLQICAKLRELDGALQDQCRFKLF